MKIIMVHEFVDQSVKKSFWRHDFFPHRGFIENSDFALAIITQSLAAQAAVLP